MPSYNHKNGSKYWWITELDGPWQVYSSKETAFGVIVSGFGIINIQNGQHKAMPKQIQSRRARNRFDMAMEQAKGRNIQYRRDVCMLESQGYNRQDARHAIIAGLSDIITSENATCIAKDDGVYAKRRLLEINKIAKSLMSLLHRIDMYEAEQLGIFSAISVRNSHRESGEG